MTNKIKLFNKGKRTILGKCKVHKKDFALKPEQCAAFEQETGAYLKKLYPDELISMDDVQKEFDKQNSEPAAPAPAEASAPAAGTPEAKSGLGKMLLNKLGG